ncbi:TIGR04255 family protein [Hylemonella gracilis]|uniref:TIGR04255 family protein n=1 Tax=Hylemonella gracilis TaxID=80880 RepID=UPI0009DF8817|nr:TIGR04255 family protein [Hylemonella gracilis]
MTAERRLSNAPLVEVIAEIHWVLDDNMQGNPVDPSWFKMAMQIEPVLQSILPVIEPLQPFGTVIPLDVLGREPLIRFRPKPGAWPLAQIGQGIVTVNATPPYDGWDAVRNLLSRILTSARDASPLFAALRPERCQLTYRDAFTEDHGVTDIDHFLSKQVQLINQSSLDILSKVVGKPAIIATSEIRAAHPSLPNTNILVRGSRGQIKNTATPRQAAILDFVVNGAPDLKPLDVASILSWFDQAHSCAWDVFTSVIPSDIMGNLKREKGSHA